MRVQAPRLGAAAVAALVGGCMHMPVATIAKLWSFDMTTADPAVLRTAVRGPDVLRTRPGGVKLVLTTWHDGAPQRTTRTFVLEEIAEAEELARLQRHRRKGEAIAAFRLAAADIAVMRGLQQENRAAAAGAKTKARGSIGVSADACRAGPLPSGPILTTTYLLLDPADGYLPLLEDVDLRKEIEPAKLATDIPPCEAK